MIVIDASVLTSALADDGTDGDRARQRLIGGGDLLAPDLVDAETASALRGLWLAGDITARRFSAALDDLGDLDLIRVPCLPLLRRAYELRANVTAYDALYVALAEGADCSLVTADRRLARAPGIRCTVELLTT